MPGIFTTQIRREAEAIHHKDTETRRKAKTCGRGGGTLWVLVWHWVRILRPFFLLCGLVLGVVAVAIAVAGRVEAFLGGFGGLFEELAAGDLAGDFGG